VRTIKSFYTYQDYLDALADGNLTDFVRRVINAHKQSKEYKTALAADEYDAERNVTILEFAREIFSANGQRIKDETVSNMKLTSNYFARLNTQRCTYSLGNGLTFAKDGIAEKLGANSDKHAYDAGYYGLIHGVSFIYWAYDHIHLFKLTEFAPLWNEETSDLGAGVRFWQLAPEKPLYATLYTVGGFIEYRSADGSTGSLRPVTGEFEAYRMTVQSTPATTGDVLTAHNYSALPIIPVYGSRNHQSTLVGMRSKIDAYDIVQSGFANDMQDCAQIYWLINGAGGMNDKDLSRFRERLLYRHIASAPNSDDVKVTPYTQEIPYNAREALLTRIKAQIYEDFGGLDVSNISAGAKTATEINSAYQPMDENADDFEYQIIEAIRKLLALQGVSAEDATPQFKRNRIANETERTQMVMTAAQYLDDEAALNHLPWLTPEEVEEILKRKAAEDMERLTAGEDEDEPDEVNEDGEAG
jgi:hypothetical protein